MIRPTLRRGSGYGEIDPHVRDDVRALQRGLSRWGYMSIVPDGEFGPVTEGAVCHFQRQQGLLDDGVVNGQVWRALSEQEPRCVAVGFAAPSPAPTAPEPAPQAPPPAASAGGGAPWMEFARREQAQGVHEIRGRAANPRIVEYHSTTTLRSTSDEVAWCSSFVNWCMRRAGIEGTHSAGAVSWMNWGIGCTARYGAVTVLYNPGAANSRTTRTGNHVGFLIEETPVHYRLLGGNQSDSVKMSNFVKRSWRLKGYRWPAG